jgi:hypothetical protein
MGRTLAIALLFTACAHSTSTGTGARPAVDEGPDEQPVDAVEEPAGALDSGNAATDEGPHAAAVTRCAVGDDAVCLGLAEVQEHTASDLVVQLFTELLSQRATEGSLAACLGGEGQQCSRIAVALEAPGQAASGPPPALAQRFHRLACAFGYWFSCNNLTVTYLDPLGEQISRRTFEDGCSSTGDPSSCYWAGARYTAGVGNQPRDLDRGYALIARACESGYGTGCYDLANLYSAGLHGFPVDLSFAYLLLERGCQGGSPDACNELRSPARELRQSCNDGVALHCAILERR